MASIKKSGTGWRAQVALKGVRVSRTFSTKAEAQAWAAQRETEVHATANTSAAAGAGKNLNDAIKRYLAEVSIHKRGHRWECTRLNALARHQVDGISLGTIPLANITPDILGKWRDARMRGTSEHQYRDKVSGSTINRDLNLLSHLFTTARREWKWIADSPTKDVRRPKESPHRDRLITDDEIERLCLALGFSESPVTTKSGAVAVAFLFAIETAMRAGEICGLKRQDIHGRVAHLSQTKNDTKRDVPLSPRALELLSLLPQHETVFDIGTATVDALFRKARKRAAIENLRFHDSRHEAITRLARKLNVLELARMVGHKNLEELQTYYNESAAELAKKLL